jgi:two-component system, OmpR family, copper resistance phosphate regulon response regulator CusR
MSVAILVVEDDRRIRETIVSALEAEHYSVLGVDSSEEAWFLLCEQKFQLIVLDINLPKRDGVEFLKLLRQRDAETAVLVVSARDSVEQRVEGLAAGADDYVVKPFALVEVVMRVHSLLRRGRTDQRLRYKLDDLHVDLLTRKVSRGGRNIELTVMEFDLLCFLVQNQDRIISRDMLARDVWREVNRATPLDSVIDVHISRLRKKLDTAPAKQLIHTIRGVGFLVGIDPSVLSESR